MSTLFTLVVSESLPNQVLIIDLWSSTFSLFAVDLTSTQ